MATVIICNEVQILHCIFLFQADTLHRGVVVDKGSVFKHMDFVDIRIQLEKPAGRKFFRLILGKRKNAGLIIRICSFTNNSLIMQDIQSFAAWIQKLHQFTKMPPGVRINV